MNGESELDYIRVITRKGRRDVHGDLLLAKNSWHTIIMLHGAGVSNKSGFWALRKLLFHAGVSSAAIDFIGHGETGGRLKGSSLHSRTQQALAFVGRLGIGRSVSILGSSMGAYIAIRLSELIRSENIILMVPAVYDETAYDVRFGKRFSFIIRKEDSWRNSDAWATLKNFRGGVGVISADDDEVIPKELITSIFRCCSESRNIKHLILRNATHRFDLSTPPILDKINIFIVDMARSN